MKNSGLGIRVKELRNHRGFSYGLESFFAGVYSFSTIGNDRKVKYFPKINVIK